MQIQKIRKVDDEMGTFEAKDKLTEKSDTLFYGAQIKGKVILILSMKHCLNTPFQNQMFCPVP